MGSQEKDSRVDPRALTVEQAARLLGVPAEVISRHISAGAPKDAEGRLHLVHYAAWLVARLNS